MARRIRLRTALLSIGAVVTAVGMSAAVPAAAASPADSTASAKPAGAAGHKPTVVLVHGAWADSSSWADVITQLRRAGYPVQAAGNPLRGLAIDTAAVKDVVRSITGPVINAAAGDPDVEALVYMAALAADAGESLGAKHPVEHTLPPLPTTAVPTTAADGTPGVDLYLKQDEFRARFAADVDPVTAAAMAVTQRPFAVNAASGTSEAAAWRPIPSWYLVSKQDQTIEPARSNTSRSGPGRTQKRSTLHTRSW